MTSRVIPIVLVLAALGLFFGYINPTYTGSVAALDAEIQSYDSALSAAKRFSERERELVLAREALPPDGITRLEAFLPDGVNNVELILDLNALASRSGLTLSNFDVVRGTEEETSGSGDELQLGAEGPTQSLDLSVSATGTYAAFKSFLEGVEWSLRPLDLVALDVSDSQTGVYTYTMTFRIYWLR